jgi:hypothetical protein
MKKQLTLVLSDGSPSHTSQRDEEAQQQMLAESTISLSPNPTTGLTNVAFELPAEQPFSIRAYDMSGRLVLSHDGMAVEGAKSYSLNLGNFADGVYLIDFQSEGYKAQKRLVVQKQ